MAKNYTNQEIGNWMTGKAKSASGYRNKIMSNNDRNRDSTVIGKMYFFWYDPKHKDTLPMYDRFPLVFPIERYPDGFLGLNMHYLSFNERSALLNSLMKFRNNNNMNATTKLRVTYDLLNSTSRIAGAMRPCIKRYLFTQVRSSFVEVTADEWDKAMQLPVAVWVSQG
jgi:hypothetical protein